MTSAQTVGFVNYVICIVSSLSFPLKCKENIKWLYICMKMLSLKSYC